MPTRDVGDFETEVLERSRTVPVLVDFWAEWCGPCRVLGPILERLAGQAGGRWALAKVDTERHPELADRYGVVSIPSVKLFVDGEVVDEFVGAIPESEIRRWLDAALPSPHAETVARARERIARGEFDEAARELRAVVQAEPANARARVALAEALLHADPAAAPPVLEGLEDDPELAERAEALRVLARLAAARPEDWPEGPVRPRFLEGARAVREGDYGAALEALIEVLRARRDYAGGAAKEAGRAIFMLLGIAHPVSERYHRAFSSAVLA